jgi:uncharacterized protein (DUF1697 family)
MTSTHVALLRGINVGGKNLIRMTDLVACFEAAGFGDVRTYIQSGNVVFRCGVQRGENLRDTIEGMLADAFAYRATVEIRDHERMRAVVRSAPDGFGGAPERYRYDVLFLLAPLTADEALDALTAREGVDEVWTGPGVIYTSRLIARASQSGISRLISHPAYKRITIRNWNTTTKLLALMGEA